MAKIHPKPHAILFAYPLQGHLIPFVHLAIKLASKGFTITFVNTESIHCQTFKAQSDNTTDIFSTARKSGLDIRYITVNDGLPVNFDRSLNHDQFMFSLLHVFSAHVEELVNKIVKTEMESGSRVNCLVADTFFTWPSMIAKKFRLVHVSFWTEPALVFTLYHHIPLLRENGHFGSNSNRKEAIDYIPGVSPINPKDLMSYLQASDITTVVHQIIFKAFESAREADFVLCNTVEELEKDTISALQVEKPFFAVGPVFPAGFSKSIVATSLWAESDCAQWLDHKPNRSVLYVSFGSYAHVSKEDIAEIANGLWLSKVNFIWVLRPDIVSFDGCDPLPVGFLEEIGDWGMVVPWCCQIEVLKSAKIRGFLTHCGWNSILESIWYEVPMLCFPLLTDQFTNRKLVVDDWKVAANLNGVHPVNRHEVSENINRLMMGTLGGELRNNIKEVRKMLENAISTHGSSMRNLDKFIEDVTETICNNDD
ncbi:hypothetical protein GIB67_000239 [Kingdonia uniflora]|uniref:Glycosyltransferase n=1 Tax=Kingdonia uniflora TaxID=39325 RepID=A0A7J7LBZ2_9MAGN|nr:hypothetical protein GIB67_000239 [Kingdonia uniflora]